MRVDIVIGAYYADKEVDDRKQAAAGREEYTPRPKVLLDSAEWDALRKRVYEFEALLLDAIEYNFDLLHPYSYLRKFLEKYIYSNVYCKESQTHSTTLGDSLRACMEQLLIVLCSLLLGRCIR